MTDITGKIRDIREGSPTPAEALQAISHEKAKEVESRWEQFPGKNMEGVASFQTRGGMAQIGHVQHVSNPDSLDYVEVWVGPQQGPPAFRLINPPMLVPDPQGSEILTEFDPLRQRNTVRRFRVDPLQAIAEVIASHNGSEQG
ncbi:hypothetical protein SEA_ZUKO_23 [Streptomyces phage Zuko]|uniref:Uncharacterized protein n=1 Tax=Streptomyces phage Zuko TaxID=2601695 RepID=A0A5J6D776_9CAUD|nr:hypothetical protein PP630_gp023 [Streptomyces phage Zuko]QEQ93601.1 hypothetical protein SEA_ZUKO_23 [Streptomyces phage Zuko]